MFEHNDGFLPSSVETKYSCTVNYLFTVMIIPVHDGFDFNYDRLY